MERRAQRLRELHEKRPLVAHDHPDGQRVPADLVLATVAAVRVPVTADVESGAGDGSPEAVSRLVTALLEIGVAGVDREDSPGLDGRPLHTADQHAERLRAVRGTAGADCVFVPGVVDADMIRELLEHGTYGGLAAERGFGEINGLFRG